MNSGWGSGESDLTLANLWWTLRTHLSGHGLPSEELIVERATGWMKFGLKENAAIGYGLQRGRTFIRKTKSHKKLKKERQKLC